DEPQRTLRWLRCEEPRRRASKPPQRSHPPDPPGRLPAPAHQGSRLAGARTSTSDAPGGRGARSPSEPRGGRAARSPADEPRHHRSEATRPTPRVASQHRLTRFRGSLALAPQPATPPVVEVRGAPANPPVVEVRGAPATSLETTAAKAPARP